MLALPGLISPANAQTKKPNILLIVADDLGYGELGAQGFTREIPTPHLDSIALNGTRFTSGYVTGPYCSPTRAALLTGRYQQRFGHERNPLFEPENTVSGLPLSEITIADALGKVGYKNGAIGKWHLGANELFHPLKRGFHEFFGHRLRLFRFAIAILLVLITLLPLGGRASLVVMISIPLSLAMGVIMLVLFLVFLMLGFPIAFTLMALGVGFGEVAAQFRQAHIDGVELFPGLGRFDPQRI